MRNKADKLLTPIIKLQIPECELCGGETEVAHHHVHKSKSSRLRYELENLIALCHSCHLKLHQNESYWASVLVHKRGLEWFERIDKIGREIVKTNLSFYKENYERLKEIYEKEL